MEDVQKVTLANLGEGAVVEMFDNELRKVIENIDDPNTDAETIREITIKMKLHPTKNRKAGKYNINVTSKLAGVAALENHLFFNQDKTAVEMVSAQEEINYSGNISDLKT